MFPMWEAKKNATEQLNIVFFFVLSSLKRFYKKKKKFSMPFRYGISIRWLFKLYYRFSRSFTTSVGNDNLEQKQKKKQIFFFFEKEFKNLNEIINCKHLWIGGEIQLTQILFNLLFFLYYFILPFTFNMTFRKKYRLKKKKKLKITVYFIPFLVFQFMWEFWM